MPNKVIKEGLLSLVLHEHGEGEINGQNISINSCMWIWKGYEEVITEKKEPTKAYHRICMEVVTGKELIPNIQTWQVWGMSHIKHG